MDDEKFQKMIDAIGIDGAEKLYKMHLKKANTLGLEGAQEFYESKETRKRVIELARVRGA